MPDTTHRPWFCPQDETCPAGTHDTYSARRHGCDSGAAWAAQRRYDKQRRCGTNPSRYADPRGVARRIEACHYMGWTGADIARAVGSHESNVARVRARVARGEKLRASLRDRWVPVLEEMAMRRPDPEDGHHRRARAWARRENFAPLLAWDDIDDPDAQPEGIRTGFGDHRVGLAAHRAEQVAQFTSQGKGATEIAGILGISRRRVESLRAEIRTARQKEAS